jgi:hypothetical protein
MPDEAPVTKHLQPANEAIILVVLQRLRIVVVVFEMWWIFL